MIKISSERSSPLNTGKNISGSAKSYLETGPKDDLKTVDAYDGSLAATTPNPTGGADCDCGCVDCETSDTLKVLSGGAGDSSDGDLLDSIGASLSSLSGSSNQEENRGFVAKLSSLLGSVGPGQSATTPSDGSDSRLSNILWNTLVCGETVEQPELFGSVKTRMGDVSIWLRSTGCSVGNLLSLISIENGKVGFNKENLKGRLESAMNASLGVLTEDLQNDVVATLSDLTGESVDEIQAKINEVNTYLSSDKLLEIKDFNDLLSVVPGADGLIEFFDIAAEVALIGTVVNKAIELGIPQAVKTIVDMIENDKVRQSVMKQYLREFAMSSEFDALNDALDYLGISASLAAVPDLVESILNYYTWERGTEIEDYPDRLEELLTLLNRIDAKWYLTTRNGVEVSNLSPFVYASKHALILLKMSEHALAAMVGPEYRRKDYQLVASRYHPYVVFSS